MFRRRTQPTLPSIRERLFIAVATVFSCGPTVSPSVAQQPDQVAETEQPIIPAAVGMKYSEMIELVERQVKTLRDANRPTEADQLQARLEATKKIAETGQLPASDELELHAVGLYQGEPYDLKRFQAKVRITHTGSPMILLLTSVESIHWILDIAEGVQLKQVILGGGARRGNTVEGVPKGVSIADYSGPGAPGIGYARSRDVVDSGGDQFSPLDARMFELTGLHIQTFHGDHDSREPIVIGPQSKSWCQQRATAAAEQLVDLATRESRAALWREIKDMRFPAIYLAGGIARQRNNPFDNPKVPFYGTHSVLGPLDGQINLVPELQRGTKVDPRGPIEFPFRVFNPESGEWTMVIVPDGDRMPRFSHVCAQTFDSKRRQWIIIGAGQNDHFMGSYDPEAEKPWELIRPMRRLDCHALCYSPEDDVYYGLIYSHDFQDGLAIYGFETDGAVRFRKYIDGLKGRRGPDHRDWVNIYPVGRFLVVFVQRHADGGGPDMNDGPIYSSVIDRKSGALLCTLPLIPPSSAEEQLKLLGQLRATKQKIAQPRLAPEPAPQAASEEEQERLNRARFVVANKETGHAYEVITGAPVSWETAEKLVKDFRWLGRQGHLATITSADEAEFLNKQFAGSTWLWLGAMDEGGKGVWRWADGPEKGQVFWERDKSSSSFSDWIEYSDYRKRHGNVKDEPNVQLEGTRYLVWSPGPAFPEKDPYFRQERNRGTWMDHEATGAMSGVLIEYSRPTENTDNKP
jgi:hypothetical protein